MTDRRYLPPSEYGGAVAGTASADVESANICGYQQSTVATGYSFHTVTFKEIASTTSDFVYDLKDIGVLKSTGAAWETSPAGLAKGQLYVRKIDSEGAYGDQYYYISVGNKGWSDVNGTAISRGDMLLRKGEGLIVYFKKTGATTCLFQYSGEVEINDTSSVLATGYNFTGNTTPVNVDLKDVQVKKLNGSEWETSPAGIAKGQLYIRKIDSEGAYGDMYYYISVGSKGWSDKDSNAISKESFILNPGEGVIAYFKKTGATGCQIIMPNPIEK